MSVEAVIARLGPDLQALYLRGRTLLREFWRYFVASAVALGVDYGLYAALLAFSDLHYLMAGAIAFTAGVAVAYVLSVTFVFRERRWSDRRVEFLGFLLIGIAGLGLNQAILWGGVEWVGLGETLAKAPAAAIGFLFNFGARRLLLFTAKPGA